MVSEPGQAHGRQRWDAQRFLLPAALGVLAVAVLASALARPPYALVLGSLFAGACLIAALGWAQGPSVDPYVSPLALKLAILAVTIWLQPSLVGRDPQFELAVTERILEQGTWDPGLGFTSQKARGYAHYPGLSFVTGTLALLTGLEPATLAHLVPPALTLLGLVLLIAIARHVTTDDRLALGAGLAWACFSLTNVFQAEYVHESLGFVFFLAGVYLLFQYAEEPDPAPLAAFALVSAALVFTHHLSTAFLLVFLGLFAIAHLTLTGIHVETGVRRALVPVALVAGFTVAYNTVLGDPAVFGYVESLWDTVAGGSQTQTTTQPTMPDPGDPLADPQDTAPAADPNVQQAVFYERRSRDELIFHTRILFVLGLVGLSLANLAWRGLHGSLDSKRTSLLTWSGLVLGLGLAAYVANVTVGVDAPRLLPWAFVFLVVTAADVPCREEILAGLRDRLGEWHERLAGLGRYVPSVHHLQVGVLAVLVLFAGFQLVTLPPHVVTETEEPAYYRSEVRLYFHEDEEAMADWVDTEVDDGTTILGDLTTYELVGPTDQGELTVTAPYVYSGDRAPLDPAYVTWRDEMSELYLGLDQDLARIFFPVPGEQQRTFQTSPDYAQLYATERSGVYAYA